MVPYVPYPTHPDTGAPAPARFTAPSHRRDLVFGGSISDPDTGLHVPIVAVTLHPQTGAVLPIGGTHTDPVTGLPVAIEMGSLMIDAQTQMAVPILSVALDPVTGE